ncbi:MAG: hypothetical protein NT167_00690, partial [Verrucomicrobia bacterium]|nr:hypothetical protein [Verrucomicrobiota bacterium]
EQGARSHRDASGCVLDEPPACKCSVKAFAASLAMISSVYHGTGYITCRRECNVIFAQPNHACAS